MRSTTVFYIGNALNSFGMGAIHALYVPWLLSIGLTDGQVSYLNAIYWLSVILFELPTGVLADGRGRGWSVMMGELLWAVGAFAYTHASGFGSAVACELLLSVGAAFNSGAFSAWVADAPDRTEPLQKVYATSTIVQGLFTILGTLTSGYLAQYVDHGLASFGVLGLSMSMGFLLAWCCMSGKESPPSMKEHEAFMHALARLKSSSSLRWAIGAQAGYGIFAAFNMYWSVLLLTRFTQVQVGWIWSCMFLAMVGSGWFVRSRLASRLNDGRGVALSMFVAGVPMAFLVVTASPLAWVVLMATHEFGRGAFRPFVDAYVNARVENGYRATFGSLCSFLGSIGNVLALVISGTFMSFSDQSSSDKILSLWIWTSVVSLVITLVLWRNRAPSTH